MSGVQAVCKIFWNIFGSVDGMSIKRTETTSFRMSICLDCTNGFWKGLGFCSKTDFQNMPKTLRPLLPTLLRGIRVTVYEILYCKIKVRGLEFAQFSHKKISPKEISLQENICSGPTSLSGVGGYPLVNFHITNWKITMLLMGKLTISMAILNSYFDITRGYPIKSHGKTH